MSVNLAKAIIFAYPNVVNITIPDDNSLNTKATDAQGNIVELDQTTVNNALTTLQTQELVVEQAKETAKASALAKLTALGLTQAEVTALIG